MQKLLIILEIVILVIGLLYPYIKKLGLGQLPGDILFVMESEEGCYLEFA